MTTTRQGARGARVEDHLFLGLDLARSRPGGVRVREASAADLRGATDRDRLGAGQTPWLVSRTGGPEELLGWVTPDHLPLPAARRGRVELPSDVAGILPVADLDPDLIAAGWATVGERLATRGERWLLARVPETGADGAAATTLRAALGSAGFVAVARLRVTYRRRRPAIRVARVEGDIAFGWLHSAERR